MTHSNHPLKTGESKVPPCRFAIEFTELERLNRNLIINSEPIFYAGSFYTVSIKRSNISPEFEGGWGWFIEVLVTRRNQSSTIGSYDVDGFSVNAETLNGMEVYENGTDCLNIGIVDETKTYKKNAVKRYALIPAFKFIDSRPICGVYFMCYVARGSTLKITSMFGDRGTGHSKYHLMCVPGDGSDDDFKKLGSIKMSVVIGLV
ncbi:unnamed protein product [Ambrosiozyma monospora]|uniref:Unnamed protein product n=1 Tax=Ambrosiozyma monospora TaxID=43982 RepID=A0ACB5TAM0_AMBMO|nr:unnamed protein product [Ambrosiozyma monospora]